MPYTGSQLKPLFTQSGVVENGTAFARGTGFPTANIPFEQADISGTYAGRVLVDDTFYQSAVYANQERRLLEAHLLDFTGDLYGKEIAVQLLEKIAPTEKFRDLKDRMTFIEWAVTEVKKYFNKIG